MELAAGGRKDPQGVSSAKGRERKNRSRYSGVEEHARWTACAWTQDPTTTSPTRSGDSEGVAWIRVRSSKGNKRRGMQAPCYGTCAYTFSMTRFPFQIIPPRPITYNPLLNECRRLRFTVACGLHTASYAGSSGSAMTTISQASEQRPSLRSAALAFACSLRRVGGSRRHNFRRPPRVRRG